MDVPSQVVNNYGFCLESKLFNNDGQLKGEGFTIPCQHPLTYQPGCNASKSMTENVSPQSVLFTKKISFLQNESHAKKREFFAQKGVQAAPYDLAGDNKRMKLQEPARRSQRLSDKITALQKLVSPYGKTDTASVLQEACLYIKFVQEHIQNLLQMQSSSYKNLNPQGTQQKQGNLRSEGLCVVPVTFTQKIALNKDINLVS
ncbi:transcription factor bHLH112-like isoform X1 [Cucurbita pepo subsp. pepo]|uniref:transcription factor bHLH112-like isoform X1 n=1 Tax=Cucurbita pepo subsp. pepo TaxID=3664 RepID=UPI000C9D4AF1|nr:transcription factor bHLH112-like isoform X1 [Cucurbita pepo subsp. pepo]XP_023550778.1 transcription factor bHLH112-like isoform X1 [Cucurbita pepo subsp. pepo]